MTTIAALWLLPDQDRVMDALRPFKLQPGEYMIYSLLTGGTSGWLWPAA